MEEIIREKDTFNVTTVIIQMHRSESITLITFLLKWNNIRQFFTRRRAFASIFLFIYSNLIFINFSFSKYFKFDIIIIILCTLFTIFLTFLYIGANHTNRIFICVFQYTTLCWFPKRVKLNNKCWTYFQIS